MSESLENIQVVLLEANITGERDAELFQLLKSWELENVYIILKDAGVGIEELVYLNNDDIQQMFPSYSQIGLKAKFREKLKCWRKEKIDHDGDGASVGCDLMKWINESQVFPNSPSSPSSMSSINHLESFSINVDVKSILEQTIKGKSVLDYYASNNSLSPVYQQILSNCLIDAVVVKQPRLKTSHFKYLAEQIVQTFPSEHTETFYNARNPLSKHPKGKLHDRYYNLKNRLKRCNKSGSQLPLCSVAHDVNSLEIDSTISANLKLWLKYNHSPTEEVIEKWKQSFQLRRTSILQPSNLELVFKEWPLFKHGSLGPYLVDIDFGLLHPGKSGCLLEKWSPFVSNILPYFRERISDAESKLLIQKIDESVAECSRDCIITLLLNAVLPPSLRLLNEEGPKKKQKRITIKEGKDSTISHLKNIYDFEPALSDIKERFYVSGDRLQPLLVVVGPELTDLKEYDVYFDGVKHKFSTFLASLDSCFKIFYTLNLEYPKHSINVWIFLQKYFYSISTKHEKVIPKVSGLVSFLTNCKKK